MSKIYVSSILILLLICCSFDTQQTPLGKTLFEKNCVRCHGVDGTKQSWGVKNLQMSKLDSMATIQTVQNGQKRMPAFKKKLNDSEIREIFSYLKTFKKK